VIARCLLVLVVLLGSRPSLASSPRIDLEVDATDVVHGIQHVRLVIPAHTGPVTLAYPEWIPGEHRPTGPITQLMNLHIKAGGRNLPWRRDARDAFLFHLTVPPQIRAIAVHFDFFSAPRSFGSGFGEMPDATTHLLMLAFKSVDSLSRRCVGGRARSPRRYTSPRAGRPIALCRLNRFWATR
jgi:hypothetical protein